MNVTYHKEKRDWVIYKIENPSGGIYIGKSCHYKSRIRCYRYSLAKGQPLLHHSFVKYGFDNHVFSIIEKFNSDIGFASAKEMFWIRSHVSNRSKWRNYNGLNLSDGGEGALNRVLSKETLEKMRVANKGKKLSDETKKKIGDSHRGVPKPSRVVSEETKRKISAKTKGFKFNEKQREKAKYNAIKYHAKKIAVIDHNNNIISEHISVSEALKATGVSKTSFYRIMNGKRKNFNRINFKYI